MDGMNEVATTDEVTTEVADDTSVENPEPAEQGELEETPEEQPVDVNAIAAAARRKAEAEVKARDEEYVRRFGHLKNPKTGEPIRSERDYFAALDAQDELQAKESLKENGIDPSLIDNMIANNPAVRQAQAVMAEQQNRMLYGMVNEDIAELSKLDPSITSLESVPPDVLQMAIDRNMRMTDCYKILNYGNMNAAIQQQAVNQAKGKAHLNPVNGIATQDNSVEIPQSELAMWKEYFPDKSAEELKKLYNKTM